MLEAVKSVLDKKCTSCSAMRWHLHLKELHFIIRFHAESFLARIKDNKKFHTTVRFSSLSLSVAFIVLPLVSPESQMLAFLQTSKHL